MRKGFTTIELLIVLAVIAALMSVATPLALNAVKNAKASQVAQNLRALKTAVENYFYAEKALPGSTEAIVSYISANFDWSKYDLDPTDDELEDGTGKVVISYTGGDVKYQDVVKHLPETTKLENDKPGVEVLLRKYW
ncbi:type II secretion system GspH family protein [Fervidobacterium islandicum]|uniref:Type II secretion system GspH family protein n=1 Tax=Fervidobacterium islandicum TaxID=2423 RepID=A0AAI8CK62_FERIS|nr:type II secretion system protein [Fervidobacterium islandicum]AMW32429.1 type II secretion system GspH family protein [Fervidobacterium islandicum]